MRPYLIVPTYTKLMFASLPVKAKTSVFRFASDGLDRYLVKHFAPHKLITIYRTELSNPI
ncbi:MAG: hypothetical protein J1F67_08660 [Muribaculaceae bacterium]|nr:hypothetical protein [Muribaculaceae bacterium]